MDRIKDSGSFDKGSIPFGCTTREFRVESVEFRECVSLRSLRSLKSLRFEILLVDVANDIVKDIEKEGVSK